MSIRLDNISKHFGQFQALARFLSRLKMVK